jgi:TPP-dependent pyruvate/acetoin dehydrogenase alpha subunit
MDENRLAATLYERMFLIRVFEESALDLFARGELFGTTHTYIGQEANAVGVLSRVPRSDIVFSNHRCHGHYLTIFDDPCGLMAELMGKANGVVGGVGGSQHLQRQNFYTNGVQGGIVPVAAGMALAEKLRKTGNIALVFLGDGTLGEGAVYETLNFISLWDIPLLMIVENNRYAQTTPIHLQLAGDICARAEAFGIRSAEMDTTDALQIYNEAEHIIDAVRREGKPFWWVLNTYRLSPHSKGDDFRDPQEIASYAQKDPLLVMRPRLSGEEAQRIEGRCRTRIAEAIQAARAAPFPDPTAWEKASAIS